MTKIRSIALLTCLLAAIARAEEPSKPAPIVLHAARLLDIETGKMLTPGEVLVEGERIAEAGTTVTHPAGAESSTWATARCCRA